MSKRPRKTTHLSAQLPALPALLIELEASLPCLMAQPATFSSALTRVYRCLDGTGKRQRAARTPRAPRAAKRARAEAAGADLPMSLPLFP
jgi:hypothetical protein